MMWQCSTKGNVDLFQANFANDIIMWLEEFVTVNDKNSLG